MTTYVVFRAIQAGEVQLARPIEISKKAAKEPPSKMGYKPGSVLTLDNAIKIIMVKSANDVAAALGESVAGSQAAFAERMNAEARRLGMTDSHWVNAHGLHRRRAIHVGARSGHAGDGAAARVSAVCRLFLDRGRSPTARKSRTTTI